MFKFLLPALAVAGLAATPALAQTTNANFVGPRIELNAGLDDVKHARELHDVTYGAAVGYDLPLTNRATLGAEVAAANVFDNDAREYGAGVRLGYTLSPNTLVYGRVGYTRVDLDDVTADGLNVGGGLSFALTKNLYAGAEYRYTDFEHNVGRHGAQLNVGLRF